MTIQLTNTLGGRKEPFEPLAPGRVGMYVCGPTVYDVPHVGHARAAVVFDVLRRHLIWRGYEVLYVRNITDVEDKIIRRSAELGIDPAVVSERYARSYDEAMGALGVLPPDIAPRAAAHIPEMIEMIARLIDDGHAYAAAGNVWFAVEKFPGYGKLSGRSLEDLRAGERVEPDPSKIGPLDFGLWKAAKPGEPSWNSPWGPGRPGWHIECSAMATRYLGMPFDIHGAGADLVFPHNENEIAQAEAARHTEPFAKYWLHNGHVQISGEKMGKSLKNYVTVDEILQDYAPQVLRLFLLSAQYRSPINYSPDSLDEARAVWGRFESFLRAAPDGAAPADTGLRAFAEAMDDDLNTPLAIAALHQIVTNGYQALERKDAAGAGEARAALVEGLGILGLDATTSRGSTSAALGPLVEYLLELRQQARADRDFARADEVRDRLSAAGIAVEDTAEGPRWHAT